jgi:hypothetical protein
MKSKYFSQHIRGEKIEKNPLKGPTQKITALRLNA